MTTSTEPPGDFHAFRLDLTEAVLTTVDQEGQLLVIRLWRPGQAVKVIKRQ
ncbi:hypothetical protein ACH4VR_29045 [Streptomyces sp. NPDC020883]|uniref:hypothetical protein n=1 Tax=Streptomyces sp. NPDC020883 TaxID=3365099 RepID=UPI0037A4764E